MIKSTENIPSLPGQDEPGKPVVIRQYGLLAPKNWGEDIDAELRRMNRLWNALVEIDRYAREEYHRIMNESEVTLDLNRRIEALKSEREMLIEQRNAKRAQVRSKSKADTKEVDDRINAIKLELKPLFDEAKALKVEAKALQKPLLDALETERREYVTLARQHSGLFWGNYNAVIDSYNVARVRAMKDGVDLKFHRFDGTGRLVNQIQGGITTEELMACTHSQVGLRIVGPHRNGKGGRQQGILYVTAYTGTDSEGKRMRRNVEFPIILHRPFPPGAIIKSVAVSIGQQAGKPRYQVVFTTRADSHGAAESGRSAAGVNFGWKQVRDGLRVATAAFSDGGTPQHLVLPQDWLRGMDRIRDLKGDIDTRANDMFAAVKESLTNLPDPATTSFQGLSMEDHQALWRIKCAPRTPIRRMDSLAWRIKDMPNMLFVADITGPLEQWRRWNKRTMKEMDNLRDKLIARRQDLYRVFAKQMADRVGYVVMDDTDFREAAKVTHEDGTETELHAIARANRVLAAPSEARLILKQTMAKRGAQVETYSGQINQCACGSHNVSGDIMRTCHACGAVFDTDENAARNLLYRVAEKPRAVA